MEEEAAAAGTAFQQQLCDEATCSICLDYFKDPVMIAECGHNFCKTCLDLYWGKPGSDFSCPQCRLTVERRNVIPNRTLANFVEIAKKSNPPGETGVKETWSICGKHQEPQKLFCRDDKTPICVVCDKSKEHENHKVIPVEEAVEGYEKQIRSYLEDIRLKMEKVLECKTDTNQKSQGLLEKIKKEREKTVTVFKQIHQFLEEQEHLLLDEMEEAIKEIEREQESHIAKLGKELQSLEGIVQETEKKLRQSPSHLLQDIEIFLERCAAEKYFENSPISFRVELKLKIWDFCDINPFLEQVMKQFKGTLGSGLRLQKANVHLDLDTAHPQLMVSEDGKSVMWTETYQDLPDNPERFNEWPFVLGCEEFTAGRHFWEVAVESEDGWHLGVARKTLKRKGHIRWGPHGGIWAIGKRNAGYWSCVNTPLFLDEEPRKIRVVLNCEGGRVSFYDADRGTLIHNCSEPVFSRETLHPFCDLSGNVHLTLSS